MIQSLPHVTVSTRVILFRASPPTDGHLLDVDSRGFLKGASGLARPRVKCLSLAPVTSCVSCNLKWDLHPPSVLSLQLSSPWPPLQMPQLHPCSPLEQPKLLRSASTAHLGSGSPCSLPGPHQSLTHSAVVCSEHNSGFVPSLIRWSHSEVFNFSHRSFFLHFIHLACRTSLSHLRMLPAAPGLCAFCARGPFSLPDAHFSSLFGVISQNYESLLKHDARSRAIR